MALPQGAPSPLNKPSSASSSSTGAIFNILPQTKSVQLNEIGRRCILPMLVFATALPDVNESKKALLQEYLKRSKENKEKNDKQRLEDYYKRNYKDYFGLIEGSVKGKKEELLSETEKGILEWLEKNRK
uniref:Photosystem I reaction center subunit N, chloroplastic n=1 Tax=Ananas comosus var. bracteatus TaxID=296719 RepID=A0A6V7Q286_ANACO|nr:unnamed protein product [Ananas comosus var. bracteatus]